MRKKMYLAMGMVLASVVSTVGSVPVMAEDSSYVYEPTTEYEGTTLTFWMQSYGSDPSIQREAMDKVTSDFQELTGISVEYNIVDWNSATQKLTLACTGGEAPDVADIFFTRSFEEMSTDEYGLLEINDVVEEMGGEDTWIQAGMDEACVDGDWYGIPWRADTRVLLYLSLIHI